MTLAGAATGAVMAAGLACIVAYLAGYDPQPGRPPSRWRERLRRWQVTPRQGAIALGAGLAVFAVTGWPAAGLAAVPAAIGMPRILSRRGPRNRIERLEALGSWTRRLADRLAAGRGLEDALIRSAEAPPAAIAAAVQDLAARMRSGAASTAQALTAFAADVDDPVADLVASTLMLASEQRGPGLRPVLTELASVVARDVSSRREIEAERAKSRSTLRWIAVFLALAVLGMVADRAYSHPFSTPAGQVALAVVACAWGAGLAWLHRLTDVPSPQRFLRVAPGSRGGAAGREPER